VDSMPVHGLCVCVGVVVSVCGQLPKKEDARTREEGYACDNHECLVSILPRLLSTPAKSAAKSAAKFLANSLAKTIETTLEPTLGRYCDLRQVFWIWTALGWGG